MEKCAKFLLQGIFVLCMFPAFLPNAAAEPQIETKISASSILPEESVLFSVKISWPASEGEYQFIVGSPQLVNLRVVRQGESRETLKTSGELQAVKSFIYELAPLTSGAAVIESFGIQAVNASTQELAILDVPSFNIAIQKPVSRRLIFIAGCFGLVAGGLSFLMTFLFIKKKKRAAARAAASVTKEDQAVARIRQFLENEQIQARELLADGAAVLLAYLSEKNGENYSRMPDSEILKSLKDKGFEYREQKNIEEILHTVHQVKYAGEEISVRDAKSLSGKIINFIESKRVVGHGA